MLVSAAFPGLPTVTMLMSISEFAVTGAVPPVYPVCVVVIVAVELIPGATPVTVTKPELLLMATVPDAVAVPAHM